MIELVVVLSIIAILATLSIVGYQSSFPAGAISAARNEMHGMLRFARQQAIIRGSNAMLIINYDMNDPDKFLRYIGVIVEEPFESTKWKAVHAGIYLPEGVYFVPQIVDSSTDGFSFDTAWPPAGADPDMRSEYYCTGASSPNAIGKVEYPVLNAVDLDTAIGEEQEWIGYQFGPDGRVKKSSFSICDGWSGGIGNQIVLAAARPQPTGGLRFERSEAALGIIIRQNGVSYAVDETDAL